MSDSLLPGSFDNLNELFESQFIIQLMLASSLKEEACQWRSSAELLAHQHLSSPNLPKLQQVIGHPQVFRALVITFSNCRCRSGCAPTVFQVRDAIRYVCFYFLLRIAYYIHMYFDADRTRPPVIYLADSPLVNPQCCFSPTEVSLYFPYLYSNTHLTFRLDSTSI